MDDSIQLERIVAHGSDKKSSISTRAVAVQDDSLGLNTSTEALSQQRANLPTSPADIQKQRRTAKIQLVALCCCIFVGGWNDGTLGPLLPIIQDFYHVSFTIVSLIFVITCVGVCVGALINVFCTESVGFGKLIVSGLILQIISHCIQAARPPFPVFVLSYAFYGAGSAIYYSQINGYAAAFKKGRSTKLGMVQCAYGVGAFCSPLVATQFSHMPKWNYCFLISLGVVSAALILIVTVFRLQKQDDCLLEIGQLATERQVTERSNLRQIWSRSAVHVMTVFIFFYVGVEVTIGGWIVTFIIHTREGGPSAGYISSGFFGGLALGRVALLWVTKKVGEKRAVFLYSGLALGLELVVWLVPSLIGDAIAVSLVGVLLGPFYPIAVSYTSQVLPQWMLTTSIGWIAGLGQMGSAVLPFAAGALANKFGITSLQPLLVGMMSCLVATWAVMPSSTLRHD